MTAPSVAAAAERLVDAVDRLGPRLAPAVVAELRKPIDRRRSFAVCGRLMQRLADLVEALVSGEEAAEQHAVEVLVVEVRRLNPVVRKTFVEAAFEPYGSSPPVVRLFDALAQLVAEVDTEERAGSAG